jgi:hypothetical protein
MLSNSSYVALLEDSLLPVEAYPLPENQDEIQQNPLSHNAKQQRTAITSEKIAIAVAMFNSGQSVTSVAAALGCSTRKAYDIRKKTAPRNVGDTRKAYEPLKRGRKLRPEERGNRQQMVRNMLSAHPHLQLSAVNEMLPSPVHISTICRDIKTIGFSRKALQIVPYERNTQENMIRRRQYAELISVFSDNQLVFIDETSHNLHLSSTHGYSPIDKPAVQLINANRGKNLTSIVHC